MPEFPGDDRSSDSWETLAQSVAGGDAQAFERLYRRFARGIQHFFDLRLRGRVESAGELAQQTWVEIYRSLSAGNFDPQRARFSTYAYAVAYNTWLQFHRRAGRISNESELNELDLQYAHVSDAVDDPASCLIAAERIDAVRECLWETGGLTDEERQILTELCDEGSERQLAERLGVAASTIHARKKTALEKLRRCLAAKGFSGREFERDRS